MKYKQLFWYFLILIFLPQMAIGAVEILRRTNSSLILKRHRDERVNTGQMLVTPEAKGTCLPSQVRDRRGHCRSTI